jgi:secreted PhoX family phosphatase
MSSQYSAFSRRHFLLGAAGVSLGFAGLYAYMRRRERVPDLEAHMAPGFGPLRDDPDRLLDLPAGFSYQVISRAGETMDDGLLVPGRHDGMAAFAHPSGRTILIRNHELEHDDPKRGPFGRRYERLARVAADHLYDTGSGRPPPGGTTTLVFDTRTGRLEHHFLSLAGTVRNCAGGPTPWGSWLSCEETTVRAEDGLEKDHGYVFEVPADPQSGLVKAVPLRAMGRFYHEAVAVDPLSGVVYMTEDLADGLLYRFLPSRPGKLMEGGRLQALAVRGQPSLDTRNWDDPRAVPTGSRFQAAWIDLDNVEAPEDDLRYRGFQAGAARFARGEGMWYGRGAVYFACTNGGYARAGQIWKYTPSRFEGQPQEATEPGVLELFVEPNEAGLVENCDNLTVAPWGDLVVCEDGEEYQHVVGITPEGKFYKIARNVRNKSELAGATFSPDGSTLFVNIHEPGMTLAIRGPWGSGSGQTDKPEI